jgi:nicotinamide-nucleotide amidase
MEAFAEQLTPLAARVHGLLRARHETLTTAESLTGGMLGAILTSVAGASASYRGGVVVYATDLKESLIGVPALLLSERGAVDPDVAVAMAAGVRDRLGSTWGLALTGVAGPDPQDGKAVGTLFVAGASAAVTFVAEHHVAGDREAVRMAACREALQAVYMRLAGDE